MTTRLTGSLLAFAAVAAIGRAAGQEALYGAQPPRGSAFVRFANATGNPVELRPDFLPAQTLGTAQGDRVSSYAVVERVAGRALELRLQGGDNTARATLQVAPDSFATVLVRNEAGGLTATVSADSADFNQARARLTFYNATPDCPAGSLALVPAGAPIFTGVEAGSSRSRSVNPVKATVQAGCKGQTAADVPLENMEIGGSYSVWLMLPGTAPVTFITRDATLPYKP